MSRTAPQDQDRIAQITARLRARTDDDGTWLVVTSGEGLFLLAEVTRLTHALAEARAEKLDVVPLPRGVLVGLAEGHPNGEDMLRAWDVENELRRAAEEKLTALQAEHERLKAIPGSWAPNDIRRAFVAGAAWWEWHKEQATMWPSDRDKAETEANRRFSVEAPST